MGTCFDAGIERLYRSKETDVHIVCLFLQHDMRRVQRAAISILAMATSVAHDAENDEVDVAKEICAEIAKNGGVLMLQCVLTIRQNSLIERFSKKSQEELAQDRAMDTMIIERVRIVLKNLEKYGFTMKNIDQHGMKEEVMEEFKSYLK